MWGKRLFRPFYLFDLVGGYSILVFLVCYKNTYCSASEILKFLNSAEILDTESNSSSIFLLPTLPNEIFHWKQTYTLIQPRE